MQMTYLFIVLILIAIDSLVHRIGGTFESLNLFIWHTQCSDWFITLKKILLSIDQFHYFSLAITFDLSAFHFISLQDSPTDEYITEDQLQLTDKSFSLLDPSNNDFQKYDVRGSILDPGPLRTKRSNSMAAIKDNGDDEDEPIEEKNGFLKRTPTMLLPKINMK